MWGEWEVVWQAKTLIITAKPTRKIMVGSLLYPERIYSLENHFVYGARKQSPTKHAQYKIFLRICLADFNRFKNSYKFLFKS